MIEHGKTEPMTLVRALALAACACDFVHSEESPDVVEWSQAAVFLRRVLADVRDRGAKSDWFMSYGTGPPKYRQRKE